MTIENNDAYAKSDIDLLQDIMDDLPDSSGKETERRKYSLTKSDVHIIFRIAKIASGHECPFEGIEKSEADTILNVGKNISKTQKIASYIVITGIVSAMLSGVWYAIQHMFLDWIRVHK